MMSGSPKRSPSWFAACLVLAIGGGVTGTTAVAVAPPKLDEKRMDHIRGVLLSSNSNFEWGALARVGEEVLPYIELIVADPDSDYQLARALIFAHMYLSQFDCKRLVEPTVAHLIHHDWEVKYDGFRLGRL